MPYHNTLSALFSPVLFQRQLLSRQSSTATSHLFSITARPYYAACQKNKLKGGKSISINGLNITEPMLTKNNYYQQTRKRLNSKMRESHPKT